MKHFKYLLFLLATFQLYNVNAQECWYELNTITTKWGAANTSNRENWDWTVPNDVHPVYLQNNMNSPSFLIELPYFCGNNAGSGSCQNKNTIQYEILANNGDSQDIYPKDGWELVLKNFGTPNTPGVTPEDGRGTTIPFYILYNKYTGRMKIYVALVGSSTATSAYLMIKFDDKTQIKRSVFAHAEIVSKSLQSFNNQLTFKTLNNYAEKTQPLDYQWLVSDVQTAYDPCTCDDKTSSTLISITPVLVSHSVITATIEGDIIQELADASEIRGESDGNTSFSTMVAAGQAAIKGYNDYNRYTSKINDILDRKNNAYKDKLVNEWFDDFIQNNPQYQNVTNLPDKYAIWDALRRTDDGYKKTIGIPEIEDYQNNSNFQNIKTVASYLPYVGTAVGLIDFFMGGGKDYNPPKPSPPMVFNLSLKLNGDISDERQQTGVSFSLPGHKINGTSNLTPIYNNILGVFTILKDPVVNAVKVMKNDFNLGHYATDLSRGEVYDINDKYDITVGNPVLYNSGVTYMHEKPIFIQYKLNEDLKYLVNPASNLSVQAIDACMVMEYTFDNIVDLQITKIRLDQNLGTDYNDNPEDGTNHISFNHSLPFYPSMLKSGLTLEQRIAEIEAQGLDLEYLSLSEKVIRFRTKYVPLTCLKNQSILLLAGLKPKIYAKMIIKYKRNDNLKSEPITEVVNYDLSSSFESPNYINQENPANITVSRDMLIKKMFLEYYELTDKYKFDFIFKGFRLNPAQTLSFPSNLAFNTFPSKANYLYTGGIVTIQVNGTIEIPDNSIIQAGTYLKARKVIIGNNVVIQNGVTIISSDPVSIPAECSIDPESTIKIERYGNAEDWNCPDIPINTVEASIQEIRGICDSQKYRQSVLSKKEDSVENPKTEAEKTQVAVFPNPVSDILNVGYKSGSTKGVSIELFDITGKDVSEKIIINNVGENSIFRINVSNLSNGVYFLSIKFSDNSQLTKKVVINK